MEYRTIGNMRNGVGANTADAVITHETVRTGTEVGARRKSSADVESFATSDEAQFVDASLAAAALVLLVCSWNTAISLVPTAAECSAAMTLTFGPAADAGLLHRAITIGSVVIPVFLCSCVVSDFLRVLCHDDSVTWAGAFVTTALGWVAACALVAIVAVRLATDAVLASIMSRPLLEGHLTGVPYLVVWMLLALGVVVVATVCAHGDLEERAGGVSGLMRTLVPLPTVRFVAAVLLMIGIPLLVACTVIAVIVLGLAAIAAVGSIAIVIIAVLFMPLVVWCCRFATKSLD